MRLSHVTSQSNLKIFTDGSCLRNPGGKGGWAALICYDKPKQLFGHSPSTTNNQMEMIAALEGMKAVEKPSHLTVYSDSQYLINGMTSWVWNWREAGWCKANGQLVSNIKIWKALITESQRHLSVKWQWIKGHAGHRENTIVDRLAGQAAREQIGQAVSRGKTQKAKTPQTPQQVKEHSSDIKTKIQPVSNTSHKRNGKVEYYQRAQQLLAARLTFDKTRNWPRGACEWPCPIVLPRSPQPTPGELAMIDPAWL